ncbi:OLC1v1030427C1 [Oldenlandia corymbosa var. corymbosa]|uniref:OLC1v1030427C1 n=1 Tax=Oldenlandia corymbosa var. corymbosa TaxID=529605 RepID=A0AAV1CI07_OLDCO|nr:OLC1v1030427C1 [Oldenlandia corymbosa var. corymbosa]
MAWISCATAISKSSSVIRSIHHRPERKRKSAILTALCVAFGSRAKTTQRASNLKGFIKTGSGAASVQVEIKNQGEDAFKPEIYGDFIVLERQITPSRTRTILKNSQGKKVGSTRGELDELVAHFGIDVENPCVVMSQDKSREFLHSGNNWDKFNFFYRATLLQRLGDLLNNVDRNLSAAAALVGEMERSLGPLLKEVEELEAKMKGMEEVEEISQEVQLLKKKLAWSWVYDVDRQLREQTKLIEKLDKRIPTCQDRIDKEKCRIDELSDGINTKKTQVEEMMERASQVKRMMDEMQQSLVAAEKVRQEFESNWQRETKQIEKMVERVKFFEEQINEIEEQHLKDTQAEELEMKQKLKEVQNKIDEGILKTQRLKKELESLETSLIVLKEDITSCDSQIEENERRHPKICSQIRDLRQNKANFKVSAFGGKRVISLLRVIERRQHRFRMPPIGPIGSHLTLDNADVWGAAVEHAIGSLLNAFIVTDHGDLLQLRACAKEANYDGLRIIIYDFSRPKLNMPSHMLPRTNHPTVISVLHSDTPTVMNVLVDLGRAERKVLVKDYNAGKEVVFDQKVSNVKEVYTSDGLRMFSSGSAQNILPQDRKLATNRISRSYAKRIEDLEREAENVKHQAEDGFKMKRKKEKELEVVENNLESVKRRCIETELDLESKERELEDTKRAFASDGSAAPKSTTDELHQEIATIKVEIEEREVELEDSHTDSLAEADRDLSLMEREFDEAKRKKKHFEEVMEGKVLPDLKASKRESQRFQESIDDLKMLRDKKRRKIWRKEQTFKGFQDKLKACRNTLELRRIKFHRNATLAKRELTWKFNNQLGKKGINGKVLVSYEQQTLSIEVTMPQDASNTSVCDTRGLSGGERSFSTLCFALALHEMTEAPFRAMDEFDVFMDAVNRKISLDTLVDFALAQGSQWIFITPHDISMVKQEQRIKKQQMPAPRDEIVCVAGFLFCDSNLNISFYVEVLACKPREC